jgi:hypothetical protein
MGVSSSKSGTGIVVEKFPIDESLTKNLTDLSIAAARILATPDIYDITNLSKPGVCGDYAIFLKKNLEKKLLPFVVDISGTRTEVVYQNPRKAIGDIEVRKKICSSLADTMLRTIVIVVACLASIQVKNDSRETVLKAIPTLAGGAASGTTTISQVGGDINSVYDWLSIAGYVAPIQGGRVSGQPVEFQVPRAAVSRIKYLLTLERSEGNLSHGLIKVQDPNVVSPPLPIGSLRLQFLNAVSLPVQGATAVTVLPMRIIDNAGLPWCAGVFHENVFKSFSSAEHFWITDLFEQLFRRTQGAPIPSPLETREQITKANEVFQQLRRTQNPQVVLQALNQFFAQYVPGYQAGYQAPAPGYPGYPGYPQVPAYPYAMPGAYFPQQQPVVQPLRPLSLQQPGLRPSLGVAPVPATTGDYSYDIPVNASLSIRAALKQFRELIPKESSPAYARAHTLAGIETKDRTVQTSICSDSYWSSTPDKIFPWSTLQFLSIKDWKKIAENRSDTLFHGEWTTFVDDLKSVYDGSSYPKLDGPTKFLDQMRFSGVTNIPICKKPQPVLVKHQAVNDGLLSIQGMYGRHVPKVWAILNDLILVIKDPDTNQDTVQLHPNVMKGPSSQAYVDGKAKEARILLTGFYLDVEKAYKRATLALEPV